MEQQHPSTPYPPLLRAPLRMRGVFGVAWQLYKRGFWPMFTFSLLLNGVFMLLMLLLTFSMMQSTGMLQDMMREFSQFGVLARRVGPMGGDMPIVAMLSYMGLSSLLSLVYAFLIQPGYTGAVYLEMDQRMQGRRGTLYELFKFALPIGFKRFYTTFLALFVVELGAGVVIGILSGVIGMVVALSTAVSFILPGDAILGVVLMSVLVGLVALFIGVAYAAFISLAYPAAAHEGKRAFGAVGRGFKLAGKRFGRMFGALILYSLLTGVVSTVALLLPLVLLWQNIGVALSVLAVEMCVWSALVMPYHAAFCTALYVDASARVDALPRPPQPDAQQSEPTQPEQPVQPGELPEGWEDPNPNDIADTPNVYAPNPDNTNAYTPDTDVPGQESPPQE